MFLVPRNTGITGHNCSNLRCHSAALWPQFAVDLRLLPFFGAGTGLPACSSSCSRFSAQLKAGAEMLLVWNGVGYSVAKGKGGIWGRGGRKSLPYAVDVQWDEGEDEEDLFQHPLSCHSLPPLGCTVPREGHC